MREVELKAVVQDESAARAHLESAGARLVFAGRLEDRRYDDAAGRLAARDQLLRLRIYRDDTGQMPIRASLDWKGRSMRDAGYKVRDEQSTPVGDPEALAVILHQLGYRVVREVDREIAQYVLGGAIVRFERYPLMDVLVEIEGSPAAIEQAIAATGLPRSAYTAATLPDFVAQFERRTGSRAALSERERLESRERKVERRRSTDG